VRLWSIHPEYLDRMGLLGLWREALLAQQVLHGETENYKNHSHMQRFYALPKEDAMQYMSDYLFFVWQEGKLRGYKLNVNHIKDPRNGGSLSGSPRKLFTVSSGQLALEYQILCMRTRNRDHKHFLGLEDKYPSHRMWVPKPNPVFTLIHGRKEEWEKFDIASLSGEK
jgi:hypothetical protein